MNTSLPIQRRARLAGLGHGTLTAVLACAALSGIPGAALAQTAGDESNTVWSAMMIVGVNDTTHANGAVIVDHQGFNEGSLGSLSPTAFSYGNTDYTAAALYLEQVTLDGTVIADALNFRVHPGVFPAAAEDRLVLVVDGKRFQLSERPSYLFNFYAFRDHGLSWSDGDTVAVKLVDDTPPPLTASFSRMPDTHTGPAFTFLLVFSEELKNLGSGTVTGAFDVTGGTVENARRVVGNSSKAWSITVAPNSVSDTVTVTLPETTDCSAARAICTADLRPLSEAVSDTVAAPAVIPSVSVSDASAAEGDAVRFTVSLSEATSEQVTVYYVTSGGTATRGIDYTHRGGTLRFAANQTSRTVAVETKQDTVDEEDETFTLTLSSPTGSTLGDATATGTIVDDDQTPPLALSVSDASAAEGEAVEFTVSLSAAGTGQVTVAYATSDGTATAGTDYTGEEGTLTFTAGQTSKTVSIATTEDTMHEDNETFTLTLSDPVNATLGTAAATGTIVNDDEPPELTAAFSDMPDEHTGADFTFGLAFSEEIPGLSYRTLRDSAAFVVAGGSVKRARRQVQGENKAWTITIDPASASDTVIVTLPETTDCNATGSICASGGRKLSEAVTDTVMPAASSNDMAGGDTEDGALGVLDGLSPDRAAAALVGEAALSEAQLEALDRLGNRNGRYDLGDLLSWIERCRSGEASCGSTPKGPGAASPAFFLFGAAAAGRRRRSGRPRRRAVGRRRTRGSMLAVLLAAAAGWSCTGDLTGPPATGREPGPPPAPAIAPQGPGFLTVEWTAPAAGRAIGVLLELEGPGITAVEAAAGLELYRSAAPERHRIVVAGPLPEDGPLLRFRVPDRARLSLYRVRILQVTGEDYALGDPGGYRAVAAHKPTP